MKKLLAMLGVVILVGGAAACNPSNTGASSTDGAANNLLYVRGDGQQILCADGSGAVRCGSSPLSDENTIIYDCSDEGYNCIESQIFVYAVPKSGLRLDLEYRVSGAKFKVRRCSAGRFPNEDGICDSALIESECDGAKACQCFGLEENSAIALFFVRRDRGIVAMTTRPLRLSPEDDAYYRDMMPSLTYVLAGQRGFLARPLNLPSRKLNGGC